MRLLAKKNSANIVVCIFLIFFSSQIAAQNIHGTVIDKKSGDPLQGVNVFLANTMMGDATDAAGNFTIEHVPAGQFEVVASMIGYEVFSRQIIIKVPLAETMLFKLAPKVLQGETIVVDAKTQKDWRKNLKIFQKRLLGTTENAGKTSIENPYVLDFIKTDHGVLTASASEPLIMINLGLGYKIEYILRYFSTNNRHTKYAGNPKFIELEPGSRKEKRRWQKRRIKAYQGSTRHFFTELIDAANRIRSLTEQQIEQLYHKYKIKPAQNKNPLDLLQKLLTRDYLKISGYHISFPPPNKTRSVDFRPKDLPVNLAELISPSNNPDEFWIKLSQPLNVRFDKEREDHNYLDDQAIEHRWTGPQGSIIESGADSVIVERFGRYWDNFELHTIGYMGWERLAESLPYEYSPEKAN